MTIARVEGCGRTGEQGDVFQDEVAGRGEGSGHVGMDEGYGAIEGHNTMGEEVTMRGLGRGSAGLV